MGLFSRQKTPPEKPAETLEKPAAELRSVVTSLPEARHARRRGIGQLLRETRENRGGDLARIAGTLRIRTAYLEAIEEGRYDQLPGAVYALGFVRAYAVHLGLDGDEAVRRFKLEAEGLDDQRDLTFPVPLAERSIPGGTMLLVAVILAICGYGLWYYLSSSTRPRPERVAVVPEELAPPPRATAPIPPAPAPAEQPAPPAEATATPAPPATPPAQAVLPQVPAAAAPPPPPPPAEAPAPAPSAAPAPEPSATSVPARPEPASPAPIAESAPPAPSGHVYGASPAANSRITIAASGDSWVQVNNRDGKMIFGRELRAGDSYRVPDEAGLTMRTGMASVLSITVDGKPVPPISGKIRSNVLLDPERLVLGTAVVRLPRPAAPAEAPAQAPVTTTPLPPPTTTAPASAPPDAGGDQDLHPE